MAKTRTISTRVTEAEYSVLQSNAWAHGKTIGDWARDCLLLRLQTGSGGHMEQYLFTELVGIQLLLMNTLGPMLRGERLSPEQLDAVLRQVQSAKARKAQELLNKRLWLQDRGAV
jgi:mobilization protein NikA